MSTPIKFTTGIKTTHFSELASTYYVPLVAGSMLYTAATCTGWDRNKYWLTPKSAPCYLHFWVLTNATGYRLNLHRHNASTNNNATLVPATATFGGKNVWEEFKIWIREGDKFNVSINKGATGGPGAPAAGLFLWELVILEEY